VAFSDDRFPTVVSIVDDKTGLLHKDKEQNIQDDN